MSRLGDALNGYDFSHKVFSQTYGNKIDQFSKLTGGNDGAFYLFLRLAQKELRNAVAHETIWLDLETGKFRYLDGREQKEWYEMEFKEAIVLGTIASHLPHTYITALASIAILEYGDKTDKAKLPRHLVKLFSHTPRTQAAAP
jgi:hypothetical protein